MSQKFENLDSLLRFVVLPNKVCSGLFSSALCFLLIEALSHYNLSRMEFVVDSFSSQNLYSTARMYHALCEKLTFVIVSACIRLKKLLLKHPFSARTWEMLVYKRYYKRMQYFDWYDTLFSFHNYMFIRLHFPSIVKYKKIFLLM